MVSCEILGRDVWASNSGVALAQTYASIWTVKDGMVIRARDFLSHAEALEAVGLPELAPRRTAGLPVL